MEYPTIEAEPAVYNRIKKCEEFIVLQPTLERSWTNCWETLSRLAAKGCEPVKLWLDFAPFSFTWKAGGLYGGLIFHGPHDGGGNGGVPTFSVNITAVHGWALHT